MTSSGDLSLPTAESMHSVSTQYERGTSRRGTELVFTQTVDGQFLSFYWQLAAQYNLQPEQIVGQIAPQVFKPLIFAPYQERLCRVLDDLIPLQFEYPFVVANQYLIFNLTISPVLLPGGTATTALVTGELHTSLSQSEALEFIHRVEESDRAYPKEPLLRHWNAILANIRRTLKPEDIWQRTVEGVAAGMGARQCVLYSYQADPPALTAVAQSGQSHRSHLVQADLLLSDANVQVALTTFRPVIVQPASNGTELLLTSWIVATHYQGQPNGLLVLYPNDRSQPWSQFDSTLLQEIADHVGTGIAQALQFQASQALVNELRSVNEALMQQHSDLEEARQQAEAASRLKSEFLANTSHELRTPLNGVIGFLKLIMDDMADDPAEKEQFIQEAYRSAIHLLHVINDILDIAKIEAGKMQLDLNPVKLDELLTEVEKITHPLAQEKHLSFEIRTPDTRDEVILYGNYQRLLQVMLNLVGNAIKFTHEGGVTISAEVIHEKVVVQDEEMPGIVKISVADTGIGVSLEKQDQLFQTFNQIDGSRTRQYGGTGLGLAISQKLVETMGGVVNFFSMGEGLGSTVTFTAPLYINPVMVTVPLADAPDLLL